MITTSMTTTIHNILMVEDDADHRYSIHLAFAELGYEEHVKVFDSAEAFFRHLNSLPDSLLYPSLIALHFNMPGMNGAEALMRLKLNDAVRDIPVAVYSMDIEPMTNRLKTMGAAYCFEKGIEYPEVLHLAKTLKGIAEGEEVLATE